MAQQEHSHRCGNSNSSGGGFSGGGGGGGGGSGGSGSNRSSKKLKQKKVPQRGLGVAQLEKIRLEEQQKKGGATFPPNSLVSPTNSSCLAVGQCAPTNFRQTPSPFPVPLPPPPPPTDLSSPNSGFRPSSSIPNTDPLHLTPLPLPSPPNDGGGIRYPAIPGFGHGNWPRLWNGEYNLERESHRLDQTGFAVRSNMDSPYESHPIWPPPSLIQKAQQFQQQPSSSAMVNVSLGTSTSSVMEPPSNQSFYSNYYTPVWPEEDKMVGNNKRTYPFSRDNQSGPSLPCKFPPSNVPPIARRDVSGSNFMRGTDNAEPSYPSFRESPSSSTLVSEPYPKNVAIENGGNGDHMNGDFLTLATPTTALAPHSRWKHNFSSANPIPPSRELSEFECLPYQGNGDQSHEPGPSGSTTPKRPFYSFFPSAKLQTGQETAALSSCSEKVGRKLDLNLKL